MRNLSAIALVLLLLTSCASMFMHGGDLVRANYESEVLITYAAQGEGVPPGVTYQLVRTADGQEAFFERSADGSGTVITNRWNEDGADHFFCWVGSSSGYEYVVPEDRSQPVQRYVYPAGYFSVDESEGVERPVTSIDFEPVATLVPESRH